jgi:hypothetical protein
VAVAVAAEQQITPRLILAELAEEALVFLVKVLTAQVVQLEVVLVIQQAVAADLVALLEVAKVQVVKAVPVERTAEVVVVVFLTTAHL